MVVVKEEKEILASKRRSGDARVSFAKDGNSTNHSETAESPQDSNHTDPNSSTPTDGTDGGMMTTTTKETTTTTTSGDGTHTLTTRVELIQRTTPPADAKPGPPIIKLQRSPSTESHDNPFTTDGELSQKADYILRHSLISRSEIRISDPDLSKGEETIVAGQGSNLNATPNDVGPRENGKMEAGLTAKSVEVEVMSANATQPEPQQAEQVKLKEPKCKCCSIM